MISDISICSQVKDVDVRPVKTVAQYLLWLGIELFPGLIEGSR